MSSSAPPPADVEVDEPGVFSIFKDGMLVAYARTPVPEGQEGVVRRASAKAPTILATIAFGVIDCFDAKAAALIVEKAREVTRLSQILFELKLDGFDVREGELKPHTGRRRF